MTKDKFLWGSATSAYQCEGGWNADDKGISNWDDFCHSEKNNINCVTGDVASDFYHRYEEDIKLLSQGDKMHIDFLWHGHELFQMEKQM